MSTLQNTRKWVRKERFGLPEYLLRTCPSSLREGRRLKTKFRLGCHDLRSSSCRMQRVRNAQCPRTEDTQWSTSQRLALRPAPPGFLGETSRLWHRALPMCNTRDSRRRSPAADYGCTPKLPRPTRDHNTQRLQPGLGAKNSPLGPRGRLKLGCRYRGTVPRLPQSLRGPPTSTAHQTNNVNAHPGLGQCQIGMQMYALLG